MNDLTGAAGVSMRQLVAEEDELAARHHLISADRQPELDQAEDIWVYEIPRSIEPYLKADEWKVIPVRLHQCLLLVPALAAVGGLALAIAANALLYVDGHATIGPVRLVWFLWLAALGWAAWRWIEWRQTWFVITGHRLILIETRRLIGRQVTMLPVSKMRDVKLLQTVPGRLFRYGTLDFASIGTEGALDVVRFLPRPEWLYQEVCNLSMPETERKVVKRQGSAA